METKTGLLFDCFLSLFDSFLVFDQKKFKTNSNQGFLGVVNILVGEVINMESLAPGNPQQRVMELKQSTQNEAVF